MLHDTPLRSVHEEYVHALLLRTPRAEHADRPGAAIGKQLLGTVDYIPYGSPQNGTPPACEIPATFGEVELEYAAIRRAAAIMDCPHRGTLRVTGRLEDRREFLNRMVTQELKVLAPGMARQTFWLNRKGRIDADLFLIETGDAAGLWIDLDIHQAAAATRTLNEFIVMEDVQIEDVSSQFHHIAMHGKRVVEILAAACGFAPDVISSPDSATHSAINGVPVVIARRDQTGEPGFELIVPYEQTPTVWSAFFSIQKPKSKIQTPVPRPIGWHAYNIARIEAGTPLFNIDFGTTNLPHETGVLRDRVSFTKGCYLGQEIVARMENLGQPKHTLVGLRMKEDRLPATGDQIFGRGKDGAIGEDIGVVTSSTLSPMLGSVPIAFAMIKSSATLPGTTVLVNAEGEQTEATVSPLRFWPREEAPR